MARLSPAQRQETVRVTWVRSTADPGAADRLLRHEVAEELASDPEAIRIGRHCDRCGREDHGRPVVLGPPGGRAPRVSLGRAAGVAIVAVSSLHPVGVDIERCDVVWPAGSADLLLHALEAASSAEELTRLWVRKESLLKATGDGLRVEPSTLWCTGPGEDPRLLDWPPAPEPPLVSMRDVRIDGYLACVSVLGAGPAKVRVREADPAALSG